jgi:hypothetical protein
MLSSIHPYDGELSDGRMYKIVANLGVDITAKFHYENGKSRLSVVKPWEGISQVEFYFEFLKFCNNNYDVPVTIKNLA